MKTKTLAYLLMLGLVAGAPMAFAQDEQPAAEETTEATAEATEEAQPDEKAIKKEARRYWQVKTARMKKGISMLKKVKNAKTSKKVTKALTKLAEKELVAPESNEYTDVVERTFAPIVEKYTEQLDEQLERIETLDSSMFGTSDSDKAMTPELKAAVDKLK